MTFKTAEEKQAALDAISTDAPVGANLDEWSRETEAKIDEIMNTPIESDGSSDQNLEPKEPEPTLKQDEPTRTIHPVDQNPTKEPEPQPKKTDPNEELEKLKRHNEYLQQQNSVYSRQNDEKVKQLEDKITELQKSTEKPSPQPQKPKDEVDHQIISVQEEINKLEKEMNETDEDFTDPEKTMKQMKKSSQLQLKLSSLQNKKSERLLQEQAAEIESLKNDQRLKREQNEQERKETEKNLAIEQFRKENPELQGKKTYSEMDEEYSNFSREVAAIYFNILPNQAKPEDTEIAMQKYLEGNPILNEALSSRGISEPEDLRKFVILSEIDALRQGFVLDKLTGKFVNFTDASGNKVLFPSHKSAYHHLKMENGKYGKEIVQAQSDAAKSVVHAMTRREDPVELTKNQQRQDTVDDMTKERADEILRKFTTDEITLRARKNFDDPMVTQYNKALSKLGYATIDRDDV